MTKQKNDARVTIRLPKTVLDGIKAKHPDLPVALAGRVMFKRFLKDEIDLGQPTAKKGS